MNERETEERGTWRAQGRGNDRKEKKGVVDVVIRENFNSLTFKNIFFFEK